MPAVEGLRRLELVLEGPPVESSAPTSYQRLTVPAEIAPWRVEAERVSVGALPGGAVADAPPSLLMLDSSAKQVRIPGSFDPASFNQVALELLVRLEGTLRIEGLRGEQVVARGAPLGINPRLEPQRVVTDIEVAGEAPLDALVLHFDAAAGPLALASVELQQLSLQGRSPLAPGERGAASGVEESRAAWGLSSLHNLKAEFEPNAGEELRFAARRSTPSAKSASKVRLRASLGREGRGVIIHTVELHDAWQEVRLDLDALAGGRCTLSLSLESASDSASFALIEEPCVGRSLPGAPVVLLITSDTHRADHLGVAASGIEVETPTIDALARRGVFFGNAQSSSNVTIPSHVALLTGVTPRDTGVRSNLDGIGASAATLAEAFRDSGYHTVASLSARHLFEVGGAGQGFDRVDAPHEPQRDGSVTLERLQTWLPRYEGYPLFIWLHLFDAHSPYEPPAQFTNELGVDAAAGATAEELRLVEQRKFYRGEVGYLDSLIGELLSDARFDQAIIAFTGDHGENLGEHDLLFNHAELYPEVVRVPLILAWPGAPQGTRVEQPTSHLGIARSLLDLAGLTEVDFPGESLLADLGEARESAPLYAIADHGRSASIRHRDEYLVLHLTDYQIGKGRQAAHGETFLFDLAQDPGCTEDLVDERFERARGLRASLVRWLASPRDLGWAHGESTSPEQRADLAKLGYTAGEGASGGELIDPDCDCDWCRRFGE